MAILFLRILLILLTHSFPLERCFKEFGCLSTAVSLTQIGDGHCDRSCMNAFCGFDRPLEGLSDCDFECSVGSLCREWQRGDGVCDSDCNHSVCGYDFGDCLHCDLDCLESQINNGVCDRSCNTETCGFDGNDCKAGRLLTAPHSEIAVSSWNSGVESGDGSWPDPYTSLSLALAAAVSPLTTIYLFRGTHKLLRLTDATATAFNDVIPLGNAMNVNRIYITTLLCADSQRAECADNPAVIAVIDFTVRLVAKTEVVFENVNIDGKTTLVDNCETVGCFYCQNAEKINETYYLTDRGEEVHISTIAAPSLCDKYQFVSFLEVASTAALSLINVVISNIRYQPYSVILVRSNATVSLHNVTFTDIIVERTAGAVILYDDDNCDPCKPSTLFYDTGSVRYVNNGFEYMDGLQTGGFLGGEAWGEVTITDVMFDTNIVMKQSAGGLLDFKNVDVLRLEHCVFRYNLVPIVINIAADNYQFASLSVDSNNHIREFELPHISLKSCVFEKNRVELGLIMTTHNSNLQNLVLDGCIFTQNFNVKQTFVSFWFKGERTTAISKGLWSFPDGSPDQQYTAPRYVNVTSCLFMWNFGRTLLRFSSMSNVYIRSSVFKGNGFPESDSNGFPLMDSNSNVVSAFVDNSEVYLKKYLTDEFAICEKVVSMDQADGVMIESVTFVGNICVFGQASIFASFISRFFTLSGGQYINNYSEVPQGTLISLAYIDDPVLLSHATFQSNVNGESFSSGLIYVFKVYNLTLDSCLFDRNSIGSAGCLSIVDPRSFSVWNSTFTSNHATSGNAAVMDFFILDSGDTTYITIKQSHFSENLSEMGQGTVVRLSSNAVSNWVLLTMLEVAIIRNVGIEGSAIYIDVKVRIKPGSGIRNSKIACNGGWKGVIYNSMLEGELTLSDVYFGDNQGIVASGLVHISGSIILENSLIRNNTGSQVFVLLGIDSLKSLETRNCTFDTNGDIALFTQHAIVRDIGSKFLSNSGTSVYLTEHSEGTFVGTVFANNTGMVVAGAVGVWSESLFACVACSFVGNAATDKGGAVYVQQLSAINISDSEFIGNTAPDKGSAMLLMASYSPVSLIVNTTFVNNKVGGSGSIYLLASALNMSSVLLSDNLSNIATAGLVAVLSTLNVAKSVFRCQAGIRGGFLYVSTDSAVMFTDTMFYNGSAAYGGGMYIIGSKIDIVNCSFSEMNATNGGGFVANSGSVVTLNRVKMLHMKSVESALGFVSEGSLSVSSSTFSDFQREGLVGDKLNFSFISDSVFERGVGISGGAVSLTRSEFVTVVRTVFVGNNATIGGGVYVATTSDTRVGTVVVVQDCGFVNNTGMRGGGMYTDNLSVSYRNCDFRGNTARKNNEKSDLWGHGGAVAIDCSAASNCRFNFDNIRFDRNTAEANGGAIYWKDVRPNVTDCNFTQNNAAYGANVSSFPVAIRQLSNDRKLSEVILSEVASGQGVKQAIVVALIDHYGEIVRTDSQSSAELQAVDPHTTTLSGITKAVAVNGVFSFSEFKIIAEPGTKAEVRVVTSAIDASKQSKANDSVQYEPLINITADMRLCELGESHVGQTCEVCEPLKYSLNPNSSACLPCPSVAICLGNYTVIPRPGYWRTRADTDVFYQCLYTPACIGSPQTPNNISLTGYCAEGYTGNLCQTCINGFSRSGKYQCGKCPDQTSNVVRLVFISLAVGIVAGVMVYTTLQSAQRPKSVSSIYIKILMNYLQIVILTASFNLDWPQLVLEVFSTQETAGSFTEQAFSFDCYLQSNDDQKNEMVVYEKLVIMAIIPVLIVLISLLAWVFITGYKRSIKLPKDELTATIVILLFLAHPTLTKSFFSMFTCMSIDGKQYLLLQLDIQCWSSKHVFYSTVCALPAISLWVIGIPAICLGYLIISKRNLESVANKVRLGFLFNGYRKKAYFWEFVILYRKIVIICISVFLTTVSIPIQALCVLCVLMISMYLQDHVQPYITTELNRMELKSIACATLTIYCGLFFLTGDLGETAKFILFVSIVAVNSIFIWYWIRKMFGFYIAFAINKVPCLRRQLGSFHRVKDGLDDELFITPITSSIFPIRNIEPRPLKLSLNEMQSMQSMDDLYYLKVSYVNANVSLRDKEGIDGCASDESSILPNSPMEMSELTSNEGDYIRERSSISKNSDI